MWLLDHNHDSLDLVIVIAGDSGLDAILDLIKLFVLALPLKGFSDVLLEGHVVFEYFLDR